jgi:hypothetical protein
MFLTSVRYRFIAQETWTFLRFPAGHGAMKNVQIITPEIFEALHEVFLDALVGQRSAQQNLEIVLQFHDMDGSSWSLFRKPGSLRMTKDGEAIDPGQSMMEMIKKALGQFSPTGNADNKNQLYTAYHGIYDKNHLFSWKYGEPQPGQIGITQLVSKMLEDLQSQFCLIAGCESKKNISSIIEFTERLSALHGKLIFTNQWQRKWTVQQNVEVSPEVNSIHDNQILTLKSAKELGIMAEIQRLASPLSGPNVTPLQILEKQRSQLDHQIESLESLVGSRQANEELPKFEMAIESLCRLHAYSKLLKSTQELREYCDHNLDPKLKAYIEHAEHMGSDFRKLLEEIQSEQLLMQQQKEILISPLEELDPRKDVGQDRGNFGRTWFDRLKSPTKASLANSQKQQNGREKNHLGSFLSKISESIDAIVTKGVNILEELPAVDTQHRDLSSSLEDSLNTLAQRYTKAREDWSEIAKKYNLSNDMDLSSLVKVAVIFSRLVVMRERRQWLDIQVKDYQERIQKLAKLIHQWRKLTDSQKIDPLDQPQMIIQESLAIIRYMDSKIKRFDQLKEKFSEQNLKIQSIQFVKGYFDEELKNLLKNWRELFQEFGASYLQPDQPKVRDLLNMGTKIKNVALVSDHQSQSEEKDRRTPALVEVLLIKQIFSDENIEIFSEWLKEQCELRSPFRSVLIATDQGELVKSLAAQGASVGVMTTRNNPQSTTGAQSTHTAPSSPNLKPSQEVSRTPTTVGGKLPNRSEFPYRSEVSNQGELAYQGSLERTQGGIIHSKPTPTLRKNQVGPSTARGQGGAGGQNIGKNETSESLQMRAERVLAMLSPKDGSKLSR